MNQLSIITLAIVLFSGTLPPRIAAEERLRVGIVLPLTGALSEYGEAARNGLRMAEEEHAGTSAVRYVVEDSHYDNGTTLTALRKLRDVDKVGLAVVWGYGPGQVAAEAAENNRFPVVAISADPAISRGRKYVIRFCISIPQFSDAIIQHSRAAGIRRIGVIKTEMPFFNGMLQGMQEQLLPSESISVVSIVEPGDNDFVPGILRFKQGAFDAMAIFVLSGQVQQFFRQAAQLRLTGRLIGSDFFDSVSEVSAAGPAIEGSVFPASAVTDSFRARYAAKFHKDAQLPWAANMYDLVSLIEEQAARLSQEPSGTVLLEAMKRVTSHAGVSGAFGWTNDDRLGPGFVFPVVMKQVRKGRIVEIEEPKDNRTIVPAG